MRYSWHTDCPSKCQEHTFPEINQRKAGIMMMQTKLAMKAAPSAKAVAEATNITNGVDVDKLKETLTAVKQNPELASFSFRIQNRWIDCGENRSHVLPFSARGKVFAHKMGFTLTADEPEMLLSAFIHGIKHMNCRFRPTRAA